MAGLIAKNSGDRVDSVACESGLEGTVGAIAHCDVDTGGNEGPSHRAGDRGVGADDGLQSDGGVTPLFASSMIARIARSAPASSRIRIARATSSCSAMATGFGVSGINP